MLNTNCTQFQYFKSRILNSGLLGNISVMVMMKIGNVKTQAILNLRSKFLYVLSSTSSLAAIGTRSIPQIGQTPASSRIISGCIGQVYSVGLCDEGCSTKSIPQTGQFPCLS